MYGSESTNQIGPAEKWVFKRRISATFSGTRTIFIRTVPRIFGSVNGAVVILLLAFSPAKEGCKTIPLVKPASVHCLWTILPKSRKCRKAYIIKLVQIGFFRPLVQRQISYTRKKRVKNWNSRSSDISLVSLLIIRHEHIEVVFTGADISSTLGYTF